MRLQEVSKAVNNFRLQGFYCTKTSRELVFYGPELVGSLRITAIDQIFVCANTFESRNLIDHPDETGELLDLIGDHVAAIEEWPSEAILEVLMASGVCIRLSGRGPGEYYEIHFEKGGETIALIFG